MFGHMSVFVMPIPGTMICFAALFMKKISAESCAVCNYRTAMSIISNRLEETFLFILQDKKSYC